MLDYDRFIAGFVSGFSFQLLHPLDLIRIRLQAADKSQFTNVPRYRSYRELLQSMLKHEGLRSFYKGVLFSIIPNASFGFFMMFNHFFKKKLQKHSTFADRPTLTSFASAAVSAFSISAVFNPLYVIKTWKVIDQQQFAQRLSMWQTAKQIAAQNGVFGFMRGYSMMVLTAVNGTLTLGTIETAKAYYPEVYQKPWGVFMISGLSRVFSSALLYPLSTIRTRISQNQKFDGLKGQKYTGVLDCLQKTYKQEGIAAFYRGLGANSLKAFLSSGVLFYVYEGTYDFLKSRKRRRNEPLEALK